MKRKSHYILFIPCVVLVAYFMIVPLLGTIIPTLTNTAGGMFSQYTNFFKDSYMMLIFWRTIKISLISSAICMIIGVPVAYYISRISKKLRRLLIALTVFPALTNSVVRSYAWMSLLGKNGVIN
ncbi:ABC transporter permease, partial [Clostridium perfringens]